MNTDGNQNLKSEIEKRPMKAKKLSQIKPNQASNPLNTPVVRVTPHSPPDFSGTSCGFELESQASQKPIISIKRHP
jgi:hypothetical protein